MAGAAVATTLSIGLNLAAVLVFVQGPRSALRIRRRHLRLERTVHVAEVPVHAPPQLAKVEPLAAVAVSVTVVPLAYVALQVEPQEMPEAGVLASLAGASWEVWQAGNNVVSDSALHVAKHAALTVSPRRSRSRLPGAGHYASAASQPPWMRPRVEC